MKATLNEYVIAYLTMLSGLAVSSVAVYYSVSGLATIFSAAVIPIIVMGVALEISKIIATLWLKQHWNTAPWSIKAYLSAAVTILMLITAMGEFGFLSKSHADQAIPNADIAAKVQDIDQKIQVEQDVIAADRKSLAQLDSTVDQVMSRTNDEHGAERANNIRKSQQRERAHLTDEISNSQHKIAELNKQRAPIASELRKVESEVGPIRYIAAFFYGQTDQAVLEKAVTWVIILIISVFDPLALILLIASQVSFIEIREKNLRYKQNQIDAPSPKSADRAAHSYDDDLTDEQLANIRASVVSPVGTTVVVDSIIEQDGQEDGISNDERAFFKRARTVARQLDQDALDTSTQPVDQPVVEQPVGTDSTDSIAPPVPSSVRDEPRLVRYKVFPRKTPVQPVEEVQQEPEQPEETPVVIAETSSSYIQNEEQQESNLWSSTVTNTISPEEYLQASNEKLEEHMSNIVSGVKDGSIQMSDIPQILVSEVKARV